MSSRRHPRERGTSTLEVVGLLPVVAVALVALMQAAIAAYAITATQTAARQGARAESQGDSASAAVRAALPDWLPASISTFGPGHGVRVTVDLPDVVPGTNLNVTRDAVMP